MDGTQIKTELGYRDFEAFEYTSCRFRVPKWQILIAYNTTSNFTNVVLMTDCALERHLNGAPCGPPVQLCSFEILQRFKQSKNFHENPLKLVVFVLNTLMNYVATYLSFAHRDVLLVQTTTKQIGGVEKLSENGLMNIVFLDVATHLNRASRNNTWAKFYLSAVEGAMSVIEQFTSEFVSQANEVNSSIGSVSLDGSMSGILVSTARILQRLKGYAAFESESLATALATVCSLVSTNICHIGKASKEDSAVMRQIALESKKDSTAMKTVAILGMVFLPGTFVAAVFAMPVFNWNDNGEPVMKPGLKYFWATAMPLTVLSLRLMAVYHEGAMEDIAR
ncbi:hypothetical protein B0J14DRAFT_688010 [Halenospora varia]|nr:hypothetical protein B0J14DRAFT_688010 [Halenospora varia]